jgi:hypothetical protein
MKEILNSRQHFFFENNIERTEGLNNRPSFKADRPKKSKFIRNICS